MGKKLTIASFVALLMVAFLFVGVQRVDMAKANFIPRASVTAIWSPENKTYTSNFLTLNVSMYFFLTKTLEKSIAYNIDREENVTLTGVYYEIDTMFQGINITVPLQALSEGSHRLDIYAKPISTSPVEPDSKTVFFTIDAKSTTPSLTQILTPTQSPKLSILPSFQNSSADSWMTKTPMPINGVGGAVVVNGRIYVIGHNNNAVYEYSPDTDTWNLKTHLPTQRDWFAMAALGNKIYVIGGLVDGANAKSCSVNEVYDTITNNWETKAPMPTSRSQVEANVVNGKIYVVGGRTAGPDSTVGTTEGYDPSTDNWTTMKSMIYPVTAYASVAIDDRIYVFGGQDEFDPRMNLDTTQIYNPFTDSWSLGKPAPVVIFSAAAGATTGLAAPKKVYVIGGMAGFGQALTQNFAYDPQTDTWTNATAMSTGRYNSAVAVVNDLVYVMGGGRNMESLSTNEQYTPVGYIYPKSSFLASPSLTPSSLSTAQPAESTTPYSTITPTETPTGTLLQSPIIQPTVEPTQTPDRPKIGDFTPVLIPGGIIFIGVVAMVVLVFLANRRGKKL